VTRPSGRRGLPRPAPLPRIAIALGDPAGIGPEIALKAAMHPEVREVCRPILFGDATVLEMHAAACGLQPPVRRVLRAADAGVDGDTIPLVERRQFSPGELHVGTIAATHGESALDSAKAAIDAALAGDVDAIVAGPQTEAAIKLAGIDFDGYPTFVARCTGVPPEDAFLMLCFRQTWKAGAREVRVVHTTLHVALRHALELVTRDRVLNAVRSADNALRRMGIAAPRIAVSGLNPHAGEGGLFGDEEKEIIAPALRAAKARGVTAEGPFGADTMFLREGYDAFVVMFHDQGHILAKTQAFDGTAALTIGTPVLFSSVAHGSALDIAGKNRADPGAMIEAIRRVAGATVRET
jgi:4-hydroxythreonine-4-phosphate dehydrogenase